MAVACCAVCCRTISIVARATGERSLRPVAPPSPPKPGPHVILFAIDGAGYDQFMDAVRSGKATHIAALLGEPRGADLFAHAYSAPDAFTVMPSCSTAGWCSIITGRPPADNGVTGDEFFVREQNRFFAPIPVSTRDASDFFATIDNDLLGKIMRVPTVYQRITGPSEVSMLYVYHGAAYYSTLGGAALLRMLGEVVAGKIMGQNVRQSISGTIDDKSIPEALDVIDRHGIPSLLVIYFPGVDAYAHGSPDPLPSQITYLENHIDPDVGAVLTEYSKRHALDDTYVIFIADHGHTPVLRDSRHDLGSPANEALFEFLPRIGWRVRRPLIDLPPDQRDYQAVVAEEGFSAYLYLADRSTCRNKGELCQWSRPPRFRHDVLPVLRALYEANRSGRRMARLKGTIDLIFSRDYASQTGRRAPPFEIFDGTRLIPIGSYLSKHPRPDLVEVERRMKWFGEGPYGDRAGDIVLIGNAGWSRPIEERYYFSIAPYYAWHGSLTHQDSHIPFVVAKRNGSGNELKRMVGRTDRGPVSALDVAPLIESLLKRPVADSRPARSAAR